MMQHWFSNYHATESGRRWTDAVEHGFLTHGWNDAASKSFLDMQRGDIVYVKNVQGPEGDANPFAPHNGFVGVGRVLKAPRRTDEATLWKDGRWVPFLSVPMQGTYGCDPTPGVKDRTNWACPVEWLWTARAEDAVVIPGVNYRQYAVNLDTVRTGGEALRLLREAFPLPFV